jgi:hypothetical protein
MSPPKFVYFGCSWTYGKCIALRSGQPVDSINFDEELLLADKKAYRSLIASNFNATQLNLSRPASSNDRQFRYASERYIGIKRLNPFYRINNPDPNVTWLADTPVENNEYVIWFITSTARKEFYHTDSKEYHNEIFARADRIIGKVYAADYYDHEYELERLAQQMILWNNYFSNIGIKNIWIDTFNHHNYPIHIPNLVRFESGFNDLMTNLCIQLGYTPTVVETHASQFKSTPDDSRSKYLLELGYLNPKTLHPTVEAHQIIADLLTPKVKMLLDL